MMICYDLVPLYGRHREISESFYREMLVEYFGCYPANALSSTITRSTCLDLIKELLSIIDWEWVDGYMMSNEIISLVEEIPSLGWVYDYRTRNFYKK